MKGWERESASLSKAGTRPDRRNEGEESMLRGSLALDPAKIHPANGQTLPRKEGRKKT